MQVVIALAPAALWGVFATWIFWWLFSPVCCGILLSASEPAIQALLRNGWTVEQLNPYFYAVVSLLDALVYGFIFGFPLGLLTKRSVIFTWVTFVVAFLLTLAARMLLIPYNLYQVLENIVSWIYWGTFLATLLFTYVGYRVRSYATVHLIGRLGT